jgi:periplasmic mercuric ion binding protein
MWMKTIFLVLGFVVLSVGISAAQTAPKISTVMIQTSGNCQECKARIEGSLKSLKGVKAASFDMDTKKVDVTFATKKVDAAAIRQAISKAGYDADDVQADQEAYDGLRKCCRKGGHD